MDFSMTIGHNVKCYISVRTKAKKKKKCLGYSCNPIKIFDQSCVTRILVVGGYKNS